MTGTGPRPPADYPHWRRFVAIGDSFTEGMADEDPQREDHYIGWADRLAERMHAANAEAGIDFGYANLAIRGRKLDDVVGPQLEAALALEPDLVSIVGGGNDILRPSVSLPQLADDLEAAVVRLREAGIDVLLCTHSDPSWAPIFNKIAGRNAVFAANIWGIAQRHDCYVLDMFTLRALWDVRMWAGDRIHLSTLGHERVAQQAAWTLGLTSDAEQPWRTPLSPAPPISRREAAAGHVAWARQFAAPWVQRRLKGRSSGDGRDPKRPDVTPLDLA